ncbi:MAG: protease complex subunit PrcB family protein [candidate division WOR-3 bacterium]
MKEYIYTPLLPGEMVFGSVSDILVFNKKLKRDDFRNVSGELVQIDTSEIIYQVDFNKEMLIGVSLGKKSNAGYDVTIEKVILKDSVIYVFYKESFYDGLASQVIVYPSSFIKIPKYDYPVEFIGVNEFIRTGIKP